MSFFKNNMKKKDVVLFICGILFAVLASLADLAVKQLIINKVLFNSEIIVIKGFFSITHVRNTGAAWGIFSNATDILSVFTVICSLFLIYAIYASTVNKTVMLCFAAVLGGAAGNLAERMLRGYVTDFLAFNIFGYDFPNFNVADICITLGCIILLVYIIFIHKSGKPVFRDGTAAHRLFGE